MAENTKIEWADHTFNPWVGCSKVSPACANCYAEAWAKRSGMVKWGNNAERRRTSEANWRQPLKWDREAKKAGERLRVFCASLADVFEDREELITWRHNLYDLIRATPNLDWLLLTKRPENLRRMLPVNWLSEPQPNVWIGTTVENQEYADERIPELLKIPAAVRFLSCEPLLGPIELCRANPDPDYFRRSYLEFNQRVNDGQFAEATYNRIDWVIVGGESGPRARPSHPAWFRSLRNQCLTARVPFFFKQHGELAHWQDIARYDHQNSTWIKPDWFSDKMPGVWVESDGKTSQRTNNDDAEFVYRVGKKRAGRSLDGVEYNEFPEVSP